MLFCKNVWLEKRKLLVAYYLMCNFMIYMITERARNKKVDYRCSKNNSIKFSCGNHKIDKTNHLEGLSFHFPQTNCLRYI